MEGTSIQELYEKERMDQLNNMRQTQDFQNMQYGAMQNLQAEQGHNAANHIQQAQHAAYYNIPENHSYPRMDQYEGGCQPGMEDLARDISVGLGQDNFAGSLSEDEDASVVVARKNGGLLSAIPEMFREPLIILVLFVILSQPQVRNFIGTYIKQINPDSQGRVSMLGVVIYGIILATLFSLSKRFLL